MVDGEPLAGPAEAGHDLVGNHQDSVLRAERTDALQVSVGWNEDAVGARHRLEEERRDRLRPLELNDLFEVGEREIHRVPAALDAVIRIRNVDDARNARL